MIKTTLKQVIEAQGAINSLMSVKHLPSKVSYAVGKLAKACKSELEHYEEKRKEIFIKHGCVLSAVIDPTTSKAVLVQGQPVQEWKHPEDDEAKTKLLAAVMEGTELIDADTEIHALHLYLDKFVDKDGKDLDIPGDAFFGLDWAVKEKSE
jgi:hypothetical protein